MISKAEAWTAVEAWYHRHGYSAVAANMGEIKREHDPFRLLAVLQGPIGRLCPKPEREKAA